MISSIEWIPQGAADPNPQRIEMSTEELEAYERNTEKMKANLKIINENDDDIVDEETTQPPSTTLLDSHGLPSELKMDDYSSDEEDVGAIILGKDGDDEMNDDDDEDDDDDKRNKKDDNDDDSASEDDELMNADEDDTREYTPLDVEGLKYMGLGGIGGHNNNHNSPTADDEYHLSDDDSEREALQLKPTDALIIVAKTEDDFASLQVMVYEETGNLYCHHDIPLPSFPLCLAHGDVDDRGRAANLCAVGTFHPTIEIWNMDLLDVLEPSATVGRTDDTRRPPSSSDAPPHAAAVMALSWNKTHRHLLASASADHTVKLWDVTQPSAPPAATFRHHEDKVSCVAWHPTEGTILATGGYDRRVALVDARGGGGTRREVRVTGDCEGLVWDPWREGGLTVASEDGRVTSWDVRNLERCLWEFSASDFGVQDLAYNSHIPGLLATCHVDKTVSLWDTLNPSSLPERRPQLCLNKNMESGKLYTVSFYPSQPWLLGCAGSGNNLCLWNMEMEDAVQNTFGSRRNDATTTTSVAATDAERTSPPGETDEKGDFDAMMTTPSLLQDDDGGKTNDETMNKKKKKKKKGKKKKVHRRTRFE